MLNCIAWARDGQLLVGTVSARLARVAHNTLQFFESFDQVPERKLWNTPFGSEPDVRSLAVSTDGTIYANIHVGWIVRTMDGGKTWKNLRKGLEMDVHQVEVNPSNPAIVFAATADGFYISEDRGDSFERRNTGLSNLYSRACACFPEEEIYLLSSSKGLTEK